MRVLICIFITFLTCNYAVGTTFYISPTGSASAGDPPTAPGPCGTDANCLSIDTHDTSTFPSPPHTIKLCPGTYENADMDPPSSGTSGNVITYEAESGTPIIDNSEIITGWSNHAGNIYKATVDSGYLQSIYTYPSEPQGFVMADNTYDSDHWPAPAQSLVAMVQNTWFYDDDGDLLYVWLWNDADPSGHTMNVFTKNAIEPGIDVNNRDYLIFDGITLRNSVYNMQVQGGADNIIAQNMTLYGSSASAFRIEQSGDYVTLQDSILHTIMTTIVQVNGSYNTIQRNQIYNGAFADWQIWPGTGIILLGDNNIATKNVIHDNNYSGILFESWGGGGDVDLCYDNVASYNLIYANDTAGITVSGGDNNEILYNILYGDQDAGIVVEGGGSGGGCTVTCQLSSNNKVYGNTVYDADYYSIRIKAETANTIVKNNIFENEGDNWELRYDGDGSEGSIIDYNLWAHVSFSWDGEVYTNWGEYKAASLQDGNSATPADPLFTDDGSNDFTLTDSSPALDTGIDLGVNYRYGLDPDSDSADWVNTVATQVWGNQWNMGAYMDDFGETPGQIGVGTKTIGVGTNTINVAE